MRKPLTVGTPSYFRWLRSIEERHWWSIGIREITSALLRRHVHGDPGAVLDAGCGTGSMLGVLAALGSGPVLGIDIAAEAPKRWTDEMARAADVVVTMGCGDTCPVVPGARYEDWPLDDPAGKPVEAVRPVRDDIGRRVAGLLRSLGVDPGHG